jgi:hypothetical protein
MNSKTVETGVTMSDMTFEEGLLKLQAALDRIINGLGTKAGTNVEMKLVDLLRNGGVGEEKDQEAILGKLAGTVPWLFEGA